MDEQPGFTVMVEGAFDEDGVWEIDTAVRYRAGLTPERRAALLGHVRVELLRGIAREGARGKTLGARRAHVRLDHGIRDELGPAIPPADIAL